VVSRGAVRILVTGKFSVGIVDTKTSNLQAIIRIVGSLGLEVVVLSESKENSKIDCLLLPGVGHFGRVTKNLSDSGQFDFLKNLVSEGKPILGICLGAQLLFESSEESFGVSGFGVIPGKVSRLNSWGSTRVPHMGWNTVSEVTGHPVFEGLGPQKSYYFAHSYSFAPREERDTIAETFHGERFCSVAGAGNALAIQFHPEKSGPAGQKFLGNSLRWLCQRA